MLPATCLMSACKCDLCEDPDSCSMLLTHSAQLPPCLRPFLPRAAWIKRQRDAGQAPCSPLTNLPLPHLALLPNNLVRNMIASMRADGLLS